MKLNERLDIFYIDYEMVPLWVAENYPHALKDLNDPMLVDKLALASEAVAWGDNVSTSMREVQDSSILPQLGVVSAVEPAFYLNGRVN